jgi:hypothetical protein
MVKQMSDETTSVWIRGLRPGTKQKAEFLTDEEFAEILAKYEPEALKNGKADG